jgi:hypothetical protein
MDNTFHWPNGGFLPSGVQGLLMATELTGLWEEVYPALSQYPNERLSLWCPNTMMGLY